MATSGAERISPYRAQPTLRCTAQGALPRCKSSQSAPAGAAGGPMRAGRQAAWLTPGKRARNASGIATTLLAR